MTGLCSIGGAAIGARQDPSLSGHAFPFPRARLARCSAVFDPTSARLGRFDSRSRIFLVMVLEDVMHTVMFEPVIAHADEPMELIFSVTDRDGNAVALAGASALFKIARTPDSAPLLVKTTDDGIVLQDNTATVAFHTAELADEEENALLGDFFAQLRIARDENSLVASEGRISILPSL